MGVTHYKQLVVWQLGDELRKEVYRLAGTGQAARDLHFKDQVFRAVRKIAPNIAEGFRRFSNPDFARFLSYAYSGAGEVADWLDDGEAHGYWTATELADARLLIKRLDTGLLALLRRLRSEPGPKHTRAG